MAFDDVQLSLSRSDGTEGGFVAIATRSQLQSVYQFAKANKGFVEREDVAGPRFQTSISDSFL